jgi:hypothetical protein
VSGELHVPDIALSALDEIAPGRNRGLVKDVRVVATPVVVTELRRLVEDVGPHWGGAAMVLRDRANARADELENRTRP